MQTRSSDAPPIIWFAETGPCTRMLEKSLRPLLSRSEKQRLNNIRHPRKFREYITSRSLIRHVFCHYPELSNQAWNITEQLNAAPRVTHPAKNISLSISHSQNLIAVTVSEMYLGVDIEYRKPRHNMAALTSGFMTTAEQLRYATLSEEEQQDFFYRCWCAKEALYKLHNVLKMKKVPIEKICTISEEHQKQGLHLILKKLDNYNCQLALASQQAVTDVQYNFVSEFTFI